jgi:hypothetical protein
MGVVPVAGRVRKVDLAVETAHYGELTRLKPGRSGSGGPAV